MIRRIKNKEMGKRNRVTLLMVIRFCKYIRDDTILFGGKGRIGDQEDYKEGGAGKQSHSTALMVVLSGP